MNDGRSRWGCPMLMCWHVKILRRGDDAVRKFEVDNGSSVGGKRPTAWDGTSNICTLTLDQRLPMGFHKAVNYRHLSVTCMSSRLLKLATGSLWVTARELERIRYAMLVLSVHKTRTYYLCRLFRGFLSSQS